MSALTACWSVSLDTTCPACAEFVDLLDYPDFWDGHRFDIPEHGTDRTRNVEVTCPACAHNFRVDLEY